MKPFYVCLLSIHLFQTYLFIGVVDRVEGDHAVILLEDAGEEVIIEKNEQLKEDKWFLFYSRETEPLILTELPVLEAERKTQAKQLLEKLRSNKP